jgi:ABC-2 type transport system permease protein
VKIIYLALNHLKIVFKSKMSIFWFFALPIALTMIIGFSTGQNSSEENFPVAIFDEENSFLTNYIIEKIEQNDLFTIQLVDLNTGLNLVETNEVAGFIHFPKNLDKINFYPADRRVSPFILEKELEKSLIELNNSLKIAEGIITVFNPERDLQILALEIIPFLKETPISINFIWNKGSENTPLIPYGNNFSSPGMAILFTLMSVVFSGAGVVLSEREYKTLARLLSTPISKKTLIYGKSLGIFFIGFVQLSILIFFGQFFLGVNWGENVWATLLLSLTFVFSASGLALALAAICKNPSQLAVIGNIVVMGISMLGGCYWPIELLPSHLQRISKLFPTGWAMEGYTNIIMRGFGLNYVLPNIFILLLFGILFLTFGIYKLKLDS